MTDDDDGTFNLNPNLILRDHFDFTDVVIKYALVPELISEDAGKLDHKQKCLIIRCLLERVQPEFTREKRKLKKKVADFVQNINQKEHFMKIACICFREFKIRLEQVRKEITKAQARVLIEEIALLILSDMGEDWAETGFQMVRDYGGITPEMDTTKLRTALDSFCKQVLNGNHTLSPSLYVATLEHLFLLDQFEAAELILKKPPVEEPLPPELLSKVEVFKTYLEPFEQKPVKIVGETRAKLFETETPLTTDEKMEDFKEEYSSTSSFVQSKIIGVQIGKRKRVEKTKFEVSYDIWRGQRACKKRRLVGWSDIITNNPSLSKSSSFLSVLQKMQSQQNASQKKQLYTLQTDAFASPTPAELILILKEFFDCGPEGWPEVLYFCNRFKDKCDEKAKRQLEIVSFVEKLTNVLLQSQEYLTVDLDENMANQSASSRYKSTQCVSNFCSILKDLFGERKNEYFPFLSHCTAANCFASLLSGCITLLQARKDGNSLKDRKRTVITSREECYSEQNLDEHVKLLSKYRVIMERLLQIQLNCGQKTLALHELKFDHVLGMLADLFILQKKYRKAVTALLMEAKRAGSLSILINKNPLVRKLVRCFRRLEHWTTALVCCQFLHDKTPNGIPRERWTQGSEIAQQMKYADLYWLPYLANADLLQMLTEIILSSDKRVQKDRLMKHLKSGVLSFQPKDLGKKFLDNLYYIFVVKAVNTK